MKVYLFILLLFFCGITYSQTTITGVVKDVNKKPISGANIKIIGDSAGTVTNLDGNFELKSSKNPPYAIEVSSVGYGAKKIDIKSNNQKVSVTLVDEETLLNEIVVSASRTPERVRESAVTIERMTAKDIKKTASPTFYDGLENLKEVHMNTSSMSFKSINTRGFATVSNTRFLQLVDGMDNSSPLLNFVLGNLIGVSEIDVANVELLPGASSALYGANAFNGILFMNSQSPFTNQGITAYAKFGQTSQKAAGNNDYYDYGIRVAHAFSKHFAAKANFSFMKGTDWFATDYRDKDLDNNVGLDRSFHNYNGINVYGDEATTNLNGVAKGLLDAGRITQSQFNSFNQILPNYNISRTGYNETDLTDNVVKNAKADMSLHIRPWANDFEIILQSKFGTGNTVYQGANRYYLNNFFMQQHKLEVKGKNFFVRGYTTTEDGGRSYDMTFTALNVNRKWKDDNTWFGQYALAYVQSTLAGQTPQQAHAIARGYSDNNIVPAGIALPAATGSARFLPGTPEFKKAFNEVIANPDVLTGSRLQDNSRIWHSDANYNFKDVFKPAEIQVGGSFRLYELNSGGRIYTDANGQIDYREFGAYTQVQKKLMEDRLKLTGSVRYDKSQNFDGNFSPRVSAAYSAGENKNHNFRGSFQTGFRNPTTQDQYIGFNVGSAVLIGSAPDNLTRYTEIRGGGGANGSISATGQAILSAINGRPTSTVTLNGENAYFNSYTAASARDFANFARANPTNLQGAAALLRKTNADYVKPETVKAFDLGYRGQIKDFAFDINGYYNIYNDFLGNLNVIAPYYGTAADNITLTGAGNPNPAVSTEQSVIAIANGDTRVFQLYTNTTLEIKSLGFGLGVSKKIIKNFEISANYNYAEFQFDQSKDKDFEAAFNTPKHRVKASIGNEKLFKNFGFNLSARWNSEYLWQSNFADGMIEAATVVDAQINYSIPKLKSILKIGASNLGGQEYQQVLGAGLIGQQYFASWTITP
ncbi:TonB-dependent receptor [Flavobacterium myungsuense]|uniref:TonB-dependent receptor domain-containing protein n=1 Tax=Flavobacterium myungsuense TaxID=651823 RepID=A0ABW3J3G1_9FLAO